MEETMETIPSLAHVSSGQIRRYGSSSTFLSEFILDYWWPPTASEAARLLAKKWRDSHLSIFAFKIIYLFRFFPTALHFSELK